MDKGALQVHFGVVGDTFTGPGNTFGMFWKLLGTLWVVVGTLWVLFGMLWATLGSLMRTHCKTPGFLRFQRGQGMPMRGPGGDHRGVGVVF